ncbi:MAG: aldo/keto reductase, partial [Clostridiales bacterium]|nr:aldo/keto reductase [Clostridiales bacterium]
MDDKMPLLGFGAMRLPTLGADDKIDLPRVCEMIDAFLEKGFLYIDTAYVYHSGQSEKAMQNALVKRHPRESFRLATKMPIWITHAPADLDRIFTEQLRNCGVDYF